MCLLLLARNRRPPARSPSIVAQHVRSTANMPSPPSLRCERQPTNDDQVDTPVTVKLTAGAGETDRQLYALARRTDATRVTRTPMTSRLMSPVRSVPSMSEIENALRRD